MTSSTALVRYGALRWRRAYVAGAATSLSEPVIETQTTSVSSKKPRLTLGVLKVVPPQGSDLVLATHVPHGKADVLVLHSFYIES